jgi:hypothetical protein
MTANAVTATANAMTWLQWLPALFSAAAGFAGVCIGIWSADRRETAKRRHDFLRLQLADFYAPMLGIHREIRALSDLRVKMGEALEEAWAEKVEEAKSSGRRITHRAAEGFEEYKSSIHYDNELFETKIMDGYRAMLKLFREQLAICSADTRAFYPELVLFVDVWERHLKKTIPIEVVRKLDHTEDRLKPFYEHLQTRYDELQAKMISGRT